MPRATLAEAVTQLRAEGKDDDEIAVTFNRSKLPLPEGNFHHHTRISVRAAVGEDASGGVPR